MVSWPHELSLSEADLDPEPHRQFRIWLREAAEAGEPMPNAMALATAGAAGVPSVRMVLLEDVDERGLVFQTNIESPKALDIAAVPHVALVFFWPRLQRQVRVTGGVEPLSRDEVAAFFSATPSAIQAMLRACRQSHVIADRGELERAYAAALASASQEEGVPAHWGGYRVQIETIEFWQARENWLQDRLRYTRAARAWRIERLVP
jgi:pyridoxamine 5'-phosphate oxidase